MKQLFFITLITFCLFLTSCKTLFPTQQEAEIIEPSPIESKQNSATTNSTIISKQAGLLEAVVETPLAEAEMQKDLWKYLSNKQSIAQTQHSRIEKYRKQYLRQPRYLIQRANKAAPYLYYIISELEKRNMPIELAFTPMVESNFDPLAHSMVQAAGLWQFMPATAKGFGIQINQWYDGRRDIVASTEAALSYYQYLNKMFKGDWLLTVAAYNVGQGNILKAIKKNKAKNKATDYWSLQLPKETMQHIPKWIALSNIFLNSEQYSVKLPAIENKAAFATIDIQAPTNLVQLANLTKLDKLVFYRLNPAFNRLYIPEQHGTASILVPVESLDAFKETLANSPAKLFKVSINYQVKAGDSLSRIAKKNQTTVKELKQLNHLSSDFLKVGQQLKLPGSVEIAEQERSFFTKLDKYKKRRRYQTYKVRTGDSLWKIARKFSVTTNQLAKWNGLQKSKVLRIGQALKVWPKR